MLNCPSSSPETISKAGEVFFLALYGVNRVSHLNEARHRVYLKTVARQKVSSFFNMATLPPISEAGLQHSYRVYLLQVQQWMFVNLPPTEWGWKLEHDKLFHVPTTRDVVPENLLKLVMLCYCKTTCKKKM